MTVRSRDFPNRKRAFRRGSSKIPQNLALAALALLLAGCVSPTPYAAKTDTEYGYSEQRLEENRYRITFAGNSETQRETVENYLLYPQLS